MELGHQSLAAEGPSLSQARARSCHIVHHMVLDPRDGRTLVVAARTGHQVQALGLKDGRHELDRERDVHDGVAREYPVDEIRNEREGELSLANVAGRPRQLLNSTYCYLKRRA